MEHNSEMSFTGANMPIRFRFPIRSMQLCEQDPDPRIFYVQDRIDVGRWKERDLQDQLEKIQYGMGGDRNKSLKILSNEIFDPIYSILFHLEEVSLTVRKELLQLLINGLRNLTDLMTGTKVLEWAQENFLSHSTIATLIKEEPQCKMAIQIQNALSAYVYLITWFLSDFSKLKDLKEAALSKGRKRVAKKDKTDEQNKHEQEMNAIAIHSQQALKLLYEDVLGKDINLIWPEQKIEEDFVKCFLKTGFDLLEHNQAYTKVLDFKQVLFNLLQRVMEKFGNQIKYMQSQNNTKIIELLYNQENLAKNLAEFVSLVVERQGPQIANDIIRDLTRQIFNTDSSHETIGIKNIAIFLQKLSKRVPRAVYGNISNLLGFFDCEAYLLRQSLIKILSYTIIHVLRELDFDAETAAGSSNDQVIATRQIYQQTKHKFLELLLKRFQDKSAFCRVKVMKVFTKLTEENLVPRHMYMELFQNVIGRLKDTTVAVRRQALRLYQQMVCIYALIFDIDVTKGAKFLSMEEVLREYQQSERDFNEANQVFENQKQQLAQFRSQIMMQHPNVDSAQLQLIVSNNNQYSEAEQALRKQQDLVENAETIKNTYFELGKFLTKMDDAGTLLVMMLSSKTIADTVEVIRVFKFLHRYGFSHTEIGIRKMLTLVYSKDVAVVNAVLECYQSLYFNNDVPTQEKVKHLFSLMRNATLTDITCIEELLGKLIKDNVFERPVYNSLWHAYLNYGRNFNNRSEDLNPDERRALIQECKQEQRSAIHLLRMMGSCRVDILLDQKEKLYEQSLKFANYESPDYIIMKEAILAYEKIVQHQINRVGIADGVTENDKRHLYQMLNVVGKNFGTQDLEWFCACETVINTLFNMRQRVSHEQAKLFIDLIVRKCFRRRDEEEIDALRAQPEDMVANIEPMPLRNDLTDSHYSQLFFVVGHMAVKMLTYVEQLETDLKTAFTESFKKKKKRDSDDSNEEGKDGEDDLAQITGGKEAEVDQYKGMLDEITESSLIQEGLLGRFTPILQAMANEALRRYTTDESVLRAPHLCILERSAILALCKYMCVSQKICAENLDLIFGLVQSNIEFGVKANIIITLADLFNRFPNLLNERVKGIFMLLHDKEVHVRQQGLMVITHLILNDMLKLKGEIVDICKLLEDPDDRIKEQVKLFLHELHSKGGHIIYNLFPKAISRLSKEFKDLAKDDFENIAKNLLMYIKLDTQSQQLIESLCKKIKNSTNPIEWRNTAFCLSQLKLTEKGFLKLLELYDCYKERLIQSAEVKEYFLIIVASSKKLMKPELKQHLEDFELKINLDETSMLELKQNNRYLNTKEEIARLKKSKQKGKPAAAAQDVEMSENAGNETPSRRRSRADFVAGQADLAGQIAASDHQRAELANQAAESQLSAGGSVKPRPSGNNANDALMIEESDEDSEY